MYEISYGSKYQKGLDVKDIAKLYREEIKQEIKAGTLPKDLKLSVKISRYAGGRSLNVYVEACPSTTFYNPARLKHELEQPHDYVTGREIPFHTAEGTRILKLLKEKLGAYNFDGSEIQSDYFHVNFYGNVQLGKIECLERDAFKAPAQVKTTAGGGLYAVAAPKAEQAPEPEDFATCGV